MTKAIKTFFLYRYRRELNFWKPYYQLHLKASLWEKQSLREALCLELKQTVLSLSSLYYKSKQPTVVVCEYITKFRTLVI